MTAGAQAIKVKELGQGQKKLYMWIMLWIGRKDAQIELGGMCRELKQIESRAFKNCELAKCGENL